MKYFLAAMVLMVFAIPARAEERSSNDGNELLSSCQAMVRIFDDHDNKADYCLAGNCLGLVRGVGYACPKVCITHGVNTMQAVRVVVKYLQDHPEKLNLDNVVFIQDALTKAFPCKK